MEIFGEVLGVDFSLSPNIHDFQNINLLLGFQSSRLLAEDFAKGCLEIWLEKLPEQGTFLANFAPLNQVVCQVDETYLSSRSRLHKPLLHDVTHQQGCEAGCLATDLANESTGPYN